MGEKVQITEENIVRAVEMGLIFGVPDKAHIREICERVKDLLRKNEEFENQKLKLLALAKRWDHIAVSSQIKEILDD